MLGTGGSLTSDDESSDTSVDGFDISNNNSMLNVDGVDITGQDALEAWDASQVIMANLTINGNEYTTAASA